jgi:hypothetical protein
MKFRPTRNHTINFINSANEIPESGSTNNIRLFAVVTLNTRILLTLD